MSEERQVLYKLSKTGSILRFEVIARKIEDGAVLITRKGILNGAEQEDIEPMYPKNVGRANATTPWQQALIMYNSKINKLLDKGYKVIENIESYQDLREYLLKGEGTGALGNLLPMLAQKDTNKIFYPGFIQPKLDGVRCLAEKKNGKVILRSRNGKVFEYLSHIEKALEDSLPEGWFLDGELYHHERTLQQIVSMVKRAQPENKLIEFRAYDIIPGSIAIPFEKRIKTLYRIVNKSGDIIDEVNTHLVESEDEAYELYSDYVSKGFEGAMWRNPDGLYEPGRRSWNLIKIKGFEEEEFEIVEVVEATGRDAGTGVFTCITKEGVEFSVRPMGTRALRAEYLRDRNNLIGDLLTVRFAYFTDDGKPFHPRGITIRSQYE